MEQNWSKCHTYVRQRGVRSTYLVDILRGTKKINVQTIKRKYDLKNDFNFEILYTQY